MIMLNQEAKDSQTHEVTSGKASLVTIIAL